MIISLREIWRSQTKLLDRAPRFLLYALFLLMPIFLVPGLSLPLDLQKQMLLAIVVFGAGLLWVIDILRRGEVSFRWHITFAPLGLFVLAALISTLGSGSFTHSFFGGNGEPDSFFNILLFALLFVLIVNKLAKPEYARNAVVAFVAGAVFSALFLFANFLFSFTFPFGSPFAFGIYAGAAFLMSLIYIGINPPYQYKSVAIAAVILFLAVLLVSQWVAWAGIAVGSLLIMHFVVKNQSARGKLVLPLILLGLSLTFWFVGNPFDSVLKLSPEVRLGREASIGIAKDTIFSNVKNGLFGSGPATFRNQYNLHRSSDVNKSPFWNLSFFNGSGAITSFFVTLGVLGAGIALAFWAIFAMRGANQLFGFRFWKPKMFLNKKKGTRVDSESKRARLAGALAKRAGRSFAFAVFAGGLYFFIAWLLYETNFLLLFSGILLVALWAGLEGKEKKISLYGGSPVGRPSYGGSPVGRQFKKSSPVMFWGMTGSVAALVALVFGFYTLFRNYSAEIYYWRGVKYADSKDYASAIPEFQKAARIIEFDKYFRKFSQVIFLQTTAAYRDQTLSAEEKNIAVQRGITAAESAGVLATRANPKNSVNFEQLGDFYTNTIPVSDSAATMPFPAYNKAAELNPQSPHIPLKKARAHLANAKRFAAKDTDRAREAYANAIAEAKKGAEKALALKKDFQDALDFIASLPQ